MKKRTRVILIVIASVLLVAGLALVLFPPISNHINKRIAHEKTENFEKTLTYIISDESDAGTGVTKKTYAEAREAGEVDDEGYAVDKSGSRTSDAPVLFKADLDRLWRDSKAYNEELKTSQGSRFNGSGDFNGRTALDLRDYGIFNGIYGYVSAPSIDMLLPIYLGTSDSNMSYGAAHMTYTSLPIGGVDTNAVIAGHTGYVGKIFFDNLRELNIGDKVTVRNFWDTLTYEVIEKNTFKPNESAAAFIEDGEDLFTMFTCTPSTSGDFDRYFVKCRRVAEERELPSTEPDDETTTEPEEQTSTKSDEETTAEETTVGGQ